MNSILCFWELGSVPDRSVPFLGFNVIYFNISVHMWKNMYILKILIIISFKLSFEYCELIHFWILWINPFFEYCELILFASDISLRMLSKRGVSFLFLVGLICMFMAPSEGCPKDPRYSPSCTARCAGYWICRGFGSTPKPGCNYPSGCQCNCFFWQTC